MAETELALLQKIRYNTIMFKNGDKVLIKDCGPEIDGITGRIVGIAVDHIVKIWIVQVDKPARIPGWEWECATFPGSCLERI